MELGDQHRQGSKVGVVPIFQAVLPNGKVLMWDSVGQSAPEQMPTNNFTRALVWDPSNNTYNRRDVPTTTSSAPDTPSSPTATCW